MLATFKLRNRAKLCWI